MTMLLITAIFGFLFALFATQNTSPASIAAGSWELNNIPVYWIVLGSLLGGLFISWVINFFEGVAASWTLSRKERQLKQTQHSVQELNQKLHNLEVENAQLKNNEAVESEDEIVIPRHNDYQDKNILEKIKHSFSF